MKIYTNEIDLARPILKKFYTAPCSDYKFGVKIVQGKNYVIELNGVELESDGETGGYKTYKMTSPKEQGVELFKIRCENGQVVYIKHVTTDSTVFDVDEGGSSAEVPTKTSQLENDSGFITVDDVPTKTSELVNDSDFATNASVDEKIGRVTSSIPTKTSQLDNDSDFATKTELDTVNRNLTTNVLDMQNELDTKATNASVDEKIGGVTSSIPTKVSQIENDAGYTTQTYVDNAIGNVLTQEEF